MPDTPDHNRSISRAARAALICAVAGCLCMAGALLLGLIMHAGLAAEAVGTVHVIARLSAIPIGLAFVAALVAIGQLMAARTPNSSESHIRVALALCLVWILGMLLWEHLAS